MDKQIKKDGPKIADITKPHLRKFFECKDIGPTPELNQVDLFPKPKHGIPIKDGHKKIHNK